MASGLSNSKELDSVKWRLGEENVMVLVDIFHFGKAVLLFKRE
jgi:hypothetical protein